MRNHGRPRDARKSSAPDSTTGGEGKRYNGIVVNQTKTHAKKGEEAMAERDTNSGLFTDIANSIVSTMRDVASRSIDANVTFAKQMLDYQTQTTSWAKDGSDVSIAARAR
jgi:hypothetical protein